MTPDRLILTPEGEQALLSAEQGGVFIRPRSFAIGDFAGTEPATVPGAILGNTLHIGTIHYIQVLDGKTVRFTVVVPNTVGNGTALNITEAIVYLNDGTPLGRVRFADGILKNVKRGVHIEFMLHLAQANAHVIDVTLSEFGSVPSVGNLDNLPTPVTAIANAVAVLDAQENPDGTRSPALAYRFGAGGNSWAFSGFSRLHSGNAGLDVTDPALFKLQQVIDDFELVEDDVVVVYVASGPGVGETRRFVVNGSEEFVAVDLAFTDLSNASYLHVWKQNAMARGGSGLPSRDGVGSDWILAAGPSDGLPQWIPNSAGKTRTRGNLFHPAGKLKFSAISITPQESQRTFMLYSEDPYTAGVDETQMRLYSYRSNNNYAYMGLGGVTQFRSAFEITNNMLEFAEPIPVDADIDARLFELQPHTGMYTNCVSNMLIGDGATRIFDLPADVESIFYTIVFAGRLLVPVTAYSLDLVNRKIVFSEPPSVGMQVEVNCFVQQSIEGYSTQVTTSSIRIQDLTNIVTLPVVPQSKDLVFITEQGAHVFKSEYAVVGNKIITAANFVPGRTIEVMIFHNIRAEGSSDTGLRGMVTDMIATAKGFELQRHAAERIRVPFPEVNFDSGAGIRVTGQYPNYKIENLISERIAQDKFDRISIQKILKDGEEIVVTQRIEFKDDIMLMITADFESMLGPGFRSINGSEEMQFGVGIKTIGAKPIEYARNQAGTGESGFSVVDQEKTNVKAYSNGSRTLTYAIIAQNNPAGFVEVEARMRVINGQVSAYGSQLKINLSGLIIPRF